MIELIKLSLSACLVQVSFLLNKWSPHQVPYWSISSRLGETDVIDIPYWSIFSHTVIALTASDNTVYSATGDQICDPMSAPSCPKFLLPFSCVPLASELGSVGAPGPELVTVSRLNSIDTRVGAARFLSKVRPRPARTTTRLGMIAFEISGGQCILG